MMTIEEKRRSFYAALLRYSPETGSLRERVLDRIVMVALFGSTEIEPFTVGTIQKNIQFGPNYPSLRTEVIQQSLERLIPIGKVEQIELKKKHAYFLKKSGIDDIHVTEKSAAALFEPVLRKMLENISTLCSEENGTIVCTRFISECFARFGKQIAKVVTGELSREKLMDVIDAKASFRASIENVDLCPEAIESLKVRCMQFLRSNDQDDEKLKFFLTQGYYILQLLEFENVQFNPIADEAFHGAIFYIDTNVLLGRLLSSELASLFDEIITFASRLGIELRVTQETINETQRVAANHLEDLKTIINSVPIELVEKTRDEFIEAFLKERNAQPNFTPEEFQIRFDEIPDIFNTLNIVFDDRDANKIIGTRDVKREAQIIDEAAKQTRGYGKKIDVQLHDVSHYLVVLEERAKGNNAWFLTRDRTLSHAAVSLSPDKLPFCFPLVGFLQSISPFLESSAEVNSLVDLFSMALECDIPCFPKEYLFDIQELKLISELHEDVLSTPVDKLVLAFDYIKSKVLDGKRYELSDHTKISLELKKFLTTSADERQKALQAEVQRQKEIATKERDKREGLERGVREEVDSLKKEIIELKERETQFEKRGATEKQRELIQRIIIMFLGALVAIGIWSFDSELMNFFVRILVGLPYHNEKILLGIRFFGSIVLVITSLPLIFVFQTMYRIGLLTIIIAISLGGLNIIGPEYLSLWSSYLSIGAPIALIIYIIILKKLH